MSTLNVDKVDPSSGTALEIGSSGDTVTVPTGAGLTVTDEVKTNKISPATGTAFAMGDSGDTFTGPSGATIVNSGTATGFGITQTDFRPNALPIIINGSTSVAQRATSATGITTASYNTCDRWRVGMTTMGTWTQTQETLTSGDAFEDGFEKSFKMDCTTADASPAAGDEVVTQHRIEGNALQSFKKGTPNAKKFTVAFWIKATKTGTYILELFDTDNDRHCCTAYTVSSGDTWEYKIVNFPADTSGSIDNDNAYSIAVQFWMGAGTNFTSGTLATVWAANVAANKAVGQVNCADSTSNNFEVTGLQLEVGEFTSADLPPFQFESFGDSIKRCERYFQQNPSASGPAYAIVALGFSYGTTNVYITWNLRTTMRATPSFATTSNWSIFYASTAQTYTPSFASDHSGPDSITVEDSSLGSTVGAGQPMLLRQNADASARLKMDAEL
jgi:hypothetical protein